MPRLTKEQKKQTIDSFINDKFYDDIKELNLKVTNLVTKDAVAQYDKKLLESFKKNEEYFMKTCSVCFKKVEKFFTDKEIIYSKLKSFSSTQSLPITYTWGSIEIEKLSKSTINAVKKKAKICEEREKLRNEIEAAINGLNTRKKVIQFLPALESHLPKVQTKALIPVEHYKELNAKLK